MTGLGYRIWEKMMRVWKHKVCIDTAAAYADWTRILLTVATVDTNL